MDPVTITLAAIAVGSAVVSGFVAAFNSEDNFYAEKAQYEILRDQYYSLWEELQLQLETETANYESTQSDLASTIYAARSEMATTTQYNAISGVASNQSAYDTLNEAYRSASEAAGSRIASTATSGFRNTGTMARINETETASDQRELASLEQSTRLSILGTYINAGSTRQSQYYEIESYNSQYETNVRNWALTELQLQNDITEAQNYYEYYKTLYDEMGEWQWYDEGIKDFFGGLF